MKHVDLESKNKPFKPRLETVEAGDKDCHHVFIVDIRGDTDVMKCKRCPALRLVHHKETRIAAQVNLSRIF